MTTTTSKPHSPAKKASSSRQKKAQSSKAKGAASGPARKKGESDFKGKRRALLEQHLAEYPRVPVIKNGKRKLQREKGHWNALHTKYWAAFPWRLPLDQEPPSDDDELEKLAADPVTPEEEEQKAKIMDQTTKKYHWWLARREGAVNTGASVFSPWIERLRRQVGPPPRRIADSQFYMQHPEHKLKILAELKRRHPGVTREDRLKLLNRLAKEMLEDEPQSVKDLIREEAEKDHTEALNEFEEGLETTVEDMDEEDKAEARDKLASVAIPLLDELENHTDFALGMFCCRIKETENAQWGIEFKSIYSHNPPDAPAYCDLSKADPSGYQEVVRIFSKFVWNMRAHQLQAAGKPGPPVHAPPTATPAPAADTMPTTTHATPSTTLSPAMDGTPSTTTTLESSTSSSSAPSTTLPVTATRTTTITTGVSSESQSESRPESIAAPTTTSTPTEEQQPAASSNEEQPAASLNVEDEEDIGAIVQRIYVEEAAATGGNPWKIRNPITVDAMELKRVGEALESLGPEFMDILPHVEKPRYKVNGAASDYPPAQCLGDFWNPVGPLLRAWVCNPDLDTTRHGWSGRVQQQSPEGLAKHEELLKDPKGWQELRKKAKRAKASTWGGANAAEGLTKKRKGKDRAQDDEGDYDDGDDTDDADGDAERQGAPPKRRRKAKAAEAGTEEQPQPSAAKRPKAKPRFKAAGEKAKAVLLETDGSWARVEKEAMLSNKDWGGQWKRLVDVWWKKEEALNFADAGGRRPIAVFSTKARPEALAWWIGRGRNGTPAIGSVTTFGMGVEAWWRAINPAWRRPENQGKLKRDGAGPWVELEWPGPNGFLGVLTCLRWWAEKLNKPTECIQWLDIVEDVIWVLETMPRLWPEKQGTATTGSGGSVESSVATGKETVAGEEAENPPIATVAS